MNRPSADRGVSALEHDQQAKRAQGHADEEVRQRLDVGVADLHLAGSRRDLRPCAALAKLREQRA